MGPRGPVNKSVRWHTNHRAGQPLMLPGGACACVGAVVNGRDDPSVSARSKAEAKSRRELL